MEDKEMKVLMQKEFNELAYYPNISDFTSPLTLKNYVLKDITIVSNLIIRSHIFFDDCIIKSITICSYDEYFESSIPIITLNNCIIEDHENILGIKRRIVFSNCTFIKPAPFTRPKSGEFIGYKKCWHISKDGINVDCSMCVVKLLIPKDAKALSSFGRKCRCSKAKVLGIFDLAGNELKDINEVISDYDANFVYTVGEEVYPDLFDENWIRECSHGIHFFMTFEEAIDY